MAYIHAMDDDSARNTKKIMQLFRIDSPSDDHTGPRKSDRERWTVYIGSVQVESKSITNERVSPTETDSQPETSNWDLAKGRLDEGRGNWRGLIKTYQIWVT